MNKRYNLSLPKWCIIVLLFKQLLIHIPFNKIFLELEKKNKGIRVQLPNTAVKDVYNRFLQRVFKTNEMKIIQAMISMETFHSETS